MAYLATRDGADGTFMLDGQGTSPDILKVVH